MKTSPLEWIRGARVLMRKIIGEFDSISIWRSHRGQGELVGEAFIAAAPNDVSADVVSEHPSDEDIGREVLACNHARSRNACGKRVDHCFSLPTVVFRCNYMRERPCQNGVIGRHGLSIWPCACAIRPDVSFAIALRWRLPINRVAKRSVQDDGINHRLFGKDRGLLEMMIMPGAADEVSQCQCGWGGVEAGII